MSKAEQLNDEVYAVKEVATYLKISVPSVYTLLATKQIKYFRIGGKRGDYRVSRQSLLDFVERKENEEGSR